MTAPTDGLLIIQGRLSQAVAALHANAPRMSDATIARRMAAIERVAAEHGMTPLAKAKPRGTTATAATQLQ